MTWADSDYGYKKKITIQASQVVGDEVDFPVLISRTADADLKDEVNGGHVKSQYGYDIVFYNAAEDTLLSHEIEKYTNTTGEVVFWVKIPSLSSSSNTDIYIYYGKAGVGSDPSTSDTWDANFYGVYHFDDESSPLTDSTETQNGSENGNPVYRQTGKVGYSINFDGTGDYFNITNDLLKFTNSFTVELILKWSSIPVPSMSAWSIGDSTDYKPSLDCYLDQADNKLYWSGIQLPGWDGNFAINTDSALTVNTFYYAALRCLNDGNAVYNYLDGVQQASTDANSNIDFTQNMTTFFVHIANRGWQADRLWHGDIDELRLSPSQRSVNWLQTTQNTINDPTTFLSWNSEEEYEPPAVETEYTSFDPRKSFRENLGTSSYDEDANQQYCLSVTDNDGQSICIPIYLTEEVKSENLPNMPFMEMHIPPGGTYYEPYDVAAATRKIESFIKIHIYFTDMDNIDRTSLAKKIKDELHRLVRNNQSTTTGITFMNVEDDGLTPEMDGRQVVYHYEATLYCLYYDLC